MRKRRYAEAVARYREALRLAEPRPDYLNNLGLALFNVGDTDSARTLWTEVVRRWPGYALSARSLMNRFGRGALDSARVSPTRG
jgi:tetratricopeptide (TPR) repeat protein